MEEIFKKTADILNRRLPYTTKSKYKKMELDALFFTSFLEDLGIPGYEIYKTNRFKYDDAHFTDYILSLYQYFMPMCQKAIDTYKDANFYYYGKEAYGKIKNVHKVIENFFEYFMPEMNDLFRKMLKEKHILISPLEGYFVGSAYPLVETNESYLLLDSRTVEEDMLYLSTIVHELMHIYSSMFLKNYRKNALEELNYGLLGEATTMYSELSLLNFLKQEHIIDDDLEYDKNCKLFTNLYHYKTVYNLCDSLDDENIEVILNGIKYSINNPKHIDGIYPFDFDQSELSEGFLNSFDYTIGNAIAYELYGRELNGENTQKIVRDFLISLQEFDHYEKLMKNGFDFSLMKSDIEENQKQLKKMYKIK